jgi:hypothetical protein|tara:strand:- start:2169 stop:2810 length:642 start_codon:yes stop_codon:yes gene_type:complete
MGIKLNGATSGSVELGVPAAIGSDISFTLPGADGTAGQFLKTDGSNQLSFGNTMPNNYALVDLQQSHSVLNKSITSTSFSTDPDVQIAVSDYQQGDVVVGLAWVPCGIALTSTDTSNYGGVIIRLKWTDGTDTVTGGDSVIWYRHDGRSMKETMQLGICQCIIHDDNTTFANGSTVNLHLDWRRHSPVGTVATGVSNWGGRRLLQVAHYRKEA